jgi:uncharacterized protein (DUF1015 family)
MNYDEFQSDAEIWDVIRGQPQSVLKITMPHCDVADSKQILDEHSEAALNKARENLLALAGSPMVRTIKHALWVYEITAVNPTVRQLGLGGLARTAEIRTPSAPYGSIIRNEGIREAKAQGRADLTAAAGADLGMVNNAVDDSSGAFEAALDSHSRNAAPDFETTDESGARHRVWLVTDDVSMARLRKALSREAHAYVADGNHRSAAAALLGNKHFMTVFFPARCMNIAPYNRLIDTAGLDRKDLMTRVAVDFVVTGPLGSAFQPTASHELGLYDGASWWKLTPREGRFDPTDAAQDIDADLVQRLIFDKALGIPDARDKRLTYVGANRDALWLQAEVESGRHGMALTLPAVTMAQFINVCQQNKLMPPKSTWFVPKVRTGLVISLFDPR